MNNDTKDASPAPLSVFISYARKDMQKADAIVAGLEQNGFTVTIDRRDLSFGEEWQAELADFIRESDTVVWLVSPTSVASKWCRWELGEVQRLSKRLIPVAISQVAPDELPEALGRIHILPVGEDFAIERHLNVLVETLNMDRSWLKQHTRLADRARQWLDKKKSRDLLLVRSDLADAEQWRDRQPRTAPAPSEEILDLILQSRRAHGRRLKVLTSISLTIAVCALAISAVAVWQNRVAQTERARAESTLRAATGAANNLVSDLAVKFKQTSVPGPVVRSVLEEATQLQDLLSESFPGDVALQRSRAAALTELGEIHLEHENLSKAAETHQEALDIRRRLQSDEANSQTRREVPVSLNRLGDIRLRQGSEQGALDLYAEGLALLRSLLNEAPEDPQLWRDVSVSLEKIGTVKLRNGNLTEAQSAFDEMLAIRTQLMADNPTDQDARADLSNALENIGDLDLQRGQPVNALKSFQEALELARMLAEQDDANSNWQHLVATKLNKIGDVRLRQNEDSLVAYEESIVIMQNLALQDPGNARWQRDLFVGHSKTGDAKLASGDRSGARSSYQAGLEVMQALVDRDSANTQWQRDLSVAFERLGNVHFQTRNMDDALIAYQQSLDIRRQLTAIDANNLNWQRDLAVSLGKMGDARYGAGNAEGAIEAYQEGLRIERALAERIEANVQWRIDIAISLVKLAELGVERQQYRAEALGILKELQSAGALTAQQENLVPMLENALANGASDR
ncbi:MAG: toll/interleukin-1 receptor domain-containing protein [Alphaproteobacteria bacterium]|nr:toll/interleukin-1 receptor domain-containing protein [Alphaproteobacteria bacterium]